MSNTQGNNASQQKNTPRQFETDTQKIVHLHLQDKNHVITEEEIRSVRVGMTPMPDSNTPALREDADDERGNSNNTDPAGAPLTPWDAVEP